jgi:hypothetical protein
VSVTNGLFPPEWDDMEGAPVLPLKRVAVVNPDGKGETLIAVLAGEHVYEHYSDPEWVVIHAPLDRLIAALNRSKNEIGEAVRARHDQQTEPEP